MLQILFERYQLDRVLSQSAEAQTYQAMDTKTGQFVVVKRLGLGKINAWKRLELFEREAKTLASLNHPRIPRLLDFYREENSDGLTATLVTAWIEGESLAAKLIVIGTLMSKPLCDWLSNCFGSSTIYTPFNRRLFTVILSPLISFWVVTEIFI